MHTTPLVVALLVVAAALAGAVTVTATDDGGLAPTDTETAADPAESETTQTTAAPTTTTAAPETTGAVTPTTATPAAPADDTTTATTTAAPTDTAVTTTVAPTSTAPATTTESAPPTDEPVANETTDVRTESVANGTDSDGAGGDDPVANGTVVDELANETVDEPVVDAPTNETADEPANETVDEPVVDAPTNETADEPANETVDEPVVDEPTNESTADGSPTKEPSTNESAPGAVTITDCTTITAPGTYRVATDLSADADATACIVVAASDVVLDGQGHVLSGAGGYASDAHTAHFGVTVRGDRENVTVRDLVVTDWTHGIDIDGVADARIEDVTARGNRVGIALRNATDATVAGGAASENAMHGVRVRGHSTDTTVTDVAVLENGKRGVFLTRSTGTIVEDVRVTGGEAGVYANGATDTRVRGVVVAGATTGVELVVTNGSLVANTVVRDADVGVLVRAVHGEGHGGSDGDDHGGESDESAGHDDESDDASDRGDETDASDHEHGAPVAGPARVDGVTVLNATVGVQTVGAAGDAIVALHTDAVARPLAIDGVATVDGLDVGAGTAAFEGRDVVVGRSDDAVPAGHSLVGPAFVVENGTLADLVLGYDRSLAGGATVALWERAAANWTTVGAPTGWGLDRATGEWRPLGFEGVETTRGALQRDSLGPGSYALLAGGPVPEALDVTASVADASLREGATAAVVATVDYRGASPTAVRLDLLVDGAVAESRTVSVIAGIPVDVPFAVDLAPGDHAVSVGGVDLGPVTVAARSTARASDDSRHHHSSTARSVAIRHPDADTATVWIRGRSTDDRVVVPLAFPAATTCTRPTRLALDASEAAVGVTVHRDARATGRAPTGPVFGYVTVEAVAGPVENATLAVDVSGACLAVQDVRPGDLQWYRADGAVWVPVRADVTVAGDTVTVVAPTDGVAAFALGVRTPALVVGAASVDERTDAGETVVVRVPVENRGTARGDQHLSLSVDGVVVATTRVTVPAGETATARLETALDDPGTHRLAVNGRSIGAVDVAPAPAATGPALPTTAAPASDRPTGAPLPLAEALTIGALLAIAGVAALLFRRP